MFNKKKKEDDFAPIYKTLISKIIFPRFFIPHVLIYLENQYDHNPDCTFEINFEIESSQTFPYEVCFPF